MSDGGARVEWAIFNHLSSGKTESKHPHTQRSPREHNFYLLLWPNQEVGFEEDLRKGKIKGRGWTAADATRSMYVQDLKT